MREYNVKGQIYVSSLRIISSFLHIQTKDKDVCNSEHESVKKNHSLELHGLLPFIMSVVGWMENLLTTFITQILERKKPVLKTDGMT